MSPPIRQIRAVHDDETVTVYQAYAPEIAGPAVAAGTFVAPFKMERMTWIKPSFLWMMYRCGWATKPGQERVLSIRMTRAGFEEALSLACLSHFDPEVYADHATWLERKAVSPVRVQWDPERSLDLEPLPWRSLQVGLGGEAVRSYVEKWITRVEDITDQVHVLRERAPHEPTLLPVEEPYPLPEVIARVVGATGASR